MSMETIPFPFLVGSYLVILPRKKEDTIDLLTQFRLSIENMLKNLPKKNNEMHQKFENKYIYEYEIHLLDKLAPNKKFSI